MDGITRAQRRQLERENQALGNALQPIPAKDWPPQRADGDRRTRVWRSRNYLVQEFLTEDGTVRLSINRTTLQGNRWLDQLSWEELQQIKNELGFFAHCAIELYPPLLDEVNCANIRHLFVLKEPPSFMWRRPE